MRLGEILVRSRIITVGQLEAGLQAQVLYGGRLGTNLVELGAVDLDTLARALSMQHGVPAALQKHFDRVSAVAVRLLPLKLAGSLRAVPLGVLEQNGPRELWVALCDPHHPTAEREIAWAAEAKVMIAVASELRIMHQLERLYRIPREHRFMRVEPPPRVTPVYGERRRVVQEFPDEITIGSVLATIPPPPVEDPIEVEWPAPEPAAMPEPAAVPVVPVPAAAPAVLVPAAAPAPTPPSVAPAPAPAAAPVVTHAAPATPAAPADPRPPALSADEAVARLRSPGLGREDVGDTVLDFLRSSFGAGLVLIVRKDMALGWKGFAAGVDPTVLEAIALPLGAPSVLKLACERAAIYRGAPPPSGAALDGRLWKLLKVGAPAEVAVVPIAIRGRVVNIVYAHAPGAGSLGDEALVALSRVTAAAGQAFVRLLAERAKAAAPP